VLNLGMLTVLGFGQLANRAGLAVVFLIAGALVAAVALLLAPRANPRPVVLVPWPAGESAPARQPCAFPKGRR
jgi:hypothetical protein